MMDKIKRFISESYQQLKRVSWPTKEETLRYTLFIIGFSLALAMFLGFLDFLFGRALEQIV